MCTLCIFSVFSTVISGCFLLAYLVVLHRTVVALRRVAVNLVILNRLRVLEIAFLTLLPSAGALQVLLIVPQLRLAAVESLWIAYYCVTLLLGAGAVATLALLPAWEAFKAQSYASTQAGIATADAILLSNMHSSRGGDAGLERSDSRV